jgi:hypothetical protein
VEHHRLGTQLVANQGEGLGHRFGAEGFDFHGFLQFIGKGVADERGFGGCSRIGVSTDGDFRLATSVFSFSAPRRSAQSAFIRVLFLLDFGHSCIGGETERDDVRVAGDFVEAEDR